MTRRESQRPDVEVDEKESSDHIGVGALLRGEREKLGLSHEHISERTKLRAHILQALENEQWDKLPLPVFVKGFIHSYARAVGLEPSRLVGLYQKAFPLEQNSPLPPLEGPGNRRTGPVLLIVLVCVGLCLGVGIYLWTHYSQPLQAPGPAMPEHERTDASLLDPLRPLPHIPCGEKETQELAERQALVAEEHLESQAVDLVTEAESSPPPPLATRELKKTGPRYTLKADVKELTWVMIFVDEKDPEEHLFHPGSSHQWRAREGMDLVIGNAGGIDLEFNDRPIKNLGETGQVVRLKLPENYERGR